jgi:multiple sugar transport system permease protein
MSAVATTQAHSVVAPSSTARKVAATLVILYALITLVPLAWIVLTSFKTPPDSIAYPPKVLFRPSVEGYCNLFYTRTRQTPDYIASLPPATGECDKLVRTRNMVIAGPSNVIPRFTNSIIIAFGSTFLAVFLGTLTAYAFSRSPTTCCSSFCRRASCRRSRWRSRSISCIARSGSPTPISA